MGETIHLQNADASGKRIASLPHELLTLRTGEPEQSPLLCIVAHDLDSLEDLRSLLRLVDQDRRFEGLEEQLGIAFGEIPRLLIIHRDPLPSLFLG